MTIIVGIIAFAAGCFVGWTALRIKTFWDMEDFR